MEKALADTKDNKDTYDRIKNIIAETLSRINVDIVNQLDAKGQSRFKALKDSIIPTPTQKIHQHATLSLGTLPSDLHSYIMGFLDRDDHLAWALTSKDLSSMQTFAKDLKNAELILDALIDDTPIPVDARIQHPDLLNADICKYLTYRQDFSLNDILHKIRNGKVTMTAEVSKLLGQLTKHCEFSLSNFVLLPDFAQQRFPNYKELHSLSVFCDTIAENKGSVLALEDEIKTILQSLDGCSYQQLNFTVKNIDGDSVDMLLGSFYDTHYAVSHPNEKSYNFLYVLQGKEQPENLEVIRSLIKNTYWYIPGEPSKNLAYLMGLLKPEYKDNSDFMREIIEFNPFAIQFCPELQKKSEIAIPAINKICQITLIKSLGALRSPKLPENFPNWLPNNLLSEPRVINSIAKLIQKLPDNYNQLCLELKSNYEIRQAAKLKLG
ncbi:MAG: hypothetical protein K0S74_1815 [Chlamydiales bacterium]|nr:hypothetical protein [Chlamydiales bacterium]